MRSTPMEMGGIGFDNGAMIAHLVATMATALTLATSALAAVHPSGSAAALRESFNALQPHLEHSAFDRPLALASTAGADSVSGEVHSIVPYPFATVRAALGDVRNWCEILFLDPTVERCDASSDRAADASIAIALGRMHVPLRFSYHVARADGDYLHVRLGAAKGPFGTRDFRIELEAAPFDAGHTMLHFAFSHGYGTAARLAMQAYLSTFARDKVGFSIVERTATGAPRYVGDFRGALERNVMRYYLAIEAYLASLSAPAYEQRDARLRAWYAATQRYARQLKEDDDYLERKRAQMARHPTPS
jgi:hypothetical protein